jgi:gas vesicle protein
MEAFARSEGFHDYKFNQKIKKIMKSSKLLIGIVAGFAGGMLAGILLAPEKGSDTRQSILDKGDDYAGTLKEKFNDFIDTISQKYSNTVNGAEEMVAEGKSKYGEMISEGKDKYNEVKSEVKHATA